MMANRTDPGGCPVSSFVSNVTFDCADPYALAQFWSQVTGQPIDQECQPGDEIADVLLPDGLGCW